MPEENNVDVVKQALQQWCNTHVSQSNSGYRFVVNAPTIEGGPFLILMQNHGGDQAAVDKSHDLHNLASCLMFDSGISSDVKGERENAYIAIDPKQEGFDTCVHTLMAVNVIQSGPVHYGKILSVLHCQRNRHAIKEDQAAAASTVDTAGHQNDGPMSTGQSLSL